MKMPSSLSESPLGLFGGVKRKRTLLRPCLRLGKEIENGEHGMTVDVCRHDLIGYPNYTYDLPRLLVVLI